MANSVAAKGDSLWRRASRFFRESWVEVVKKASWPTWSELKKSTAVVIAAVIVVAIYLGGIDWILTRITHPLYGPTIPK